LGKVSEEKTAGNKETKDEQGMTKPNKPLLHCMSQHEIGCELEALAQGYEFALNRIGRKEDHLMNIKRLLEIARWMK
jgi:hypothetical protein